MILVCHASPGSQTAGFDQALDPNVIIERVARTDARVIACGHTHLPEVRDLGWKLIVNSGSAGYIFDGEPTASWARIDLDDGEVQAEIQPHRIRRARGRQRDLRPRPRGRRLPGRDGANREAGPMTAASERRRVVVTGMGLVTALGNDVASTWAGLVEGRSGVRTIEAFDPARLTCRIAAEVVDFDAGGLLDRKELRRTDRCIQFGLVAAREALDQAGLPARFEGALAERTGVILGTGLGGVGTLIDGFTTNALRGPDRISPFLIPMGIPNIGAGQVAIQFGMTGPNFTTVSACATGGHALGEASEIIRRDDADVMIAGGTEAGVYEAIVGGFAAMRALSTRNDDPAGASRPFDTGRDGFVIGEGAGVVVLEALEHAEARGAEILAELVGYGATADASHITLPAPGGIGAVRAARRALEKAGLTPDDIDHVNAHATSTPEGDKAELQAIRTIFGADVGAGLGHGQQVDARPHAGRRRRDRGDHLDPDHPRFVRATDDQPGRPGSGGGRHRPVDQRGHAADPGGPEQLLRVRWPEHRSRHHRATGMTDDATAARPPEPQDAGDVELLALIDRLADLLERSDLSELEVASGGTGVILRKPVVAAPLVAAPAAVATGPVAETSAAGEPSTAGRDPAATARPSIKAPLTGIFYASPAPGTAPYVQVGGEVAVGQVIGLIEAMKLFNEIKSDLAGRVIRVVPDSGALVKAKQPLIEVEPL